MMLTYTQLASTGTLQWDKARDDPPRDTDTHVKNADFRCESTLKTKKCVSSQCGAHFYPMAAGTWVSFNKNYESAAMASTSLGLRAILASTVLAVYHPPCTRDASHGGSTCAGVYACIHIMRITCKRKENLCGGILCTYTRARGDMYGVMFVHTHAHT